MLITRRKLLQVATAYVGTSLFPHFVLPSKAQEQAESRAIFDESLSWITRQSAETVCQRIKRAGFNVFVPCVWHGRGASWPSQYAPWDTDRLEVMARGTSSFDPLDQLLHIAQRYEIEVHPWFNVALRQRDFLPQFYDSGTPEQAFDVHRPEFRDFICNVMLECVSRYPVHGINLDYIRTTGISQSAHCIDDYRKATGRNLLVDRVAAKFTESAREAVTQWQTPPVEDIVRRVSQRVRALNRNLVISVAGFPGSYPLLIQGQDSVKWADQGWIDVVYNMNYDARPEWAAIRAIQQKMKRPEAMAMLCGNYESDSSTGVTPRDAGRVVELLQDARIIGRGNGVALYLYSMLSDSQVEALHHGVFNVPTKPKWTRANKPYIHTPADLQVR